MRSFDWLSPRGKGAAVEAARLAGAPGALLKAAGVDLLDLMKEGIEEPATVVSIAGIEELRGIHEQEGALRIGALATLAEIAADPRVLAAHPLLAEAAGSAATPQVRNLATLGGNLCQRPRCWYFRHEGFRCLKKGGSECFALDGDHRYHAIFDVRPCPIVAPSSAGLALVALDATVHLDGPRGARAVAADEFFVRAVDREVAREADEVITHVTLPAPPRGMAQAHQKVREKESFDWPLAEVGAVLVRDAGGTVTHARIVLGAVAPVPWRARASEASLLGRRLDAPAAEQAADAALQGATPLPGNAYKVDLVRELVRRAVEDVAGRP